MPDATVQWPPPNEILAAELAALPPSLKAEVVGFDSTFYGVLLPQFPLPPGRFVAEATPDSPIGAGTPVTHVDVLLRLQKLYPQAAPDMFWVRPYLRLASGGVPQASEQREAYFGKIWQRFSWHLRSGWTPMQDTLEDFVAFVRLRLKQGD